MNRYLFHILCLPDDLFSDEMKSNGFHFGDPEGFLQILNKFNDSANIVNCNVIHYNDQFDPKELPEERIVIPIAVKEWKWGEKEKQLDECFSSMPEEILSLLQRNKNLHLVFVNFTEPLSVEFIQLICKKCQRNGILFKQLIICVSDFSIKQHLVDQNVILQDCRGNKPAILSVGNAFAFGFGANSISTPPTTKIDRKKKYISLNRRPSPHRAALIAMLKDANLLEQGYVSLRTDVFPEVLKYLTNETSHWFKEDLVYRNIILNALEQMKFDNELPLLFEGDVELREGLTTHDESPMWAQDHIRQMHEDSYFSLVTESFMKHPSNCNFMSEKILKPILLKHPFVLFGSYRSLETLRSMGFQTFEPWIREDYDYEECYFQRFNMALGTATSLIMMSNSQLDQMIKEMQPILEWNRQHLLNNYENFMLRTTDYKDLLKWSNFQK